MLRKTFLQEKILQGRNCATTLIPLAIKWFVSKQHCYGIFFRFCVAREFAHDVHHMRCESRFAFLVVYFKAKLEAIYPKSVKEVINLNGYIASRAWIQNINQIIKLSIV